MVQISNAQYYNTGQDPGSLKWLQIKTERFRVIYPGSYGAAGVDLARALDDAYSRITSLYAPKKFRIPVIIHNYTTESNGYVAWAPSRMELYPTPEMNSIPLDPFTILSVHELTHVFQMESLEKGFTKFMSFLAGQQFTGIVSSLLPLWFLEGDAVFSESILTRSGRGRDASFQKQLKALVVENGNPYKYDKMLNGSFRNFVPDHYHLGYEIMAFSYLNYGRDLWKRALNFTANEPFTINPVNLSLRKSESLTKKRLFKTAFDTLGILWKKDDQNSDYETFKVLNPPRHRDFVNYYSPVSAGKDSIIAVRTSLSDPPCFVLIRPSKKAEKKIYTPGYSYPWFLSYAKGKLVWVETHSDPRWANRTWAVIKLKDLHQNITRQVSMRTRYMSASISPDGKSIAATENTVQNQNNLVILDAATGLVSGSRPSPGNAFLQKPQWSPDGKEITVISLTENGEGISSLNVGSGTWRELIKSGSNDLQSSFLRNDSLFFISSVSGTDNAYLMTPEGKIKSLTRSRFGISDLSINGSSLLFADYTSSGSNISITSIPTGSLEAEPPSSSASYLINSITSPPEAAAPEVNKAYLPVAYHKWQHLFRFHSWMPFYADIETVTSDPTMIRPGLTLLSQNNLSTLTSSFGYEYSDNMHKFHSSIKWSGWYLVLESRIDYGNPPSIEKFREQVADPADVFRNYKVISTVSLPLVFQGGRFTQNLYLSASSAYSNDYIYLKEKGFYDNGQNEITGRLYLSNYQRSSVRDIYPRWAQIIDLSYSYYPFDRDIYGDLITARSAFYFPGILRNNSLRLRYEYEDQHPKKFILGNRALFPRSYTDIISKTHDFISADYFMPLAYPDFNLASLIYLTRIRADLFYDRSEADGNYVIENGTMTYHDYAETFRSFGIQLMTDFYAFRMPFLVSAGIEAAWRYLGEVPYLKAVFNIDLFGMSIGKRGVGRIR
ncbi:MAG: hypothetical protein Q8868_06445 [Bacteroidota bacterium]|nr:hypothetical protein [Bacteroidota bacterium]